MLDGTTRFTCKGQKLSHYMLCSTFSEYTVVHESGLCKVNILLSDYCILSRLITMHYCDNTHSVIGVCESNFYLI